MGPVQSERSQSSMPICDGPQEDMVHFIVVCPTLESVRAPKKRNLAAMLQQEEICPPDNNHDWCCLILNGGTDHMDTKQRKETLDPAAL